jgi:hypothetical protein
MKFLCLAQPDPGFTPGPGLVAEYAALDEAMRAAGVLIDSGQLSPGDAAKLVRVTAGQADVSRPDAQRLLPHRLPRPRYRAGLGRPHPRCQLRHGRSPPA